MKRTIQRVWAPLLLVLMGLAQGPAATPAAPLQDSNESAVVQELFVTARYPGPALWTVQRGQGTVVVLGGLSPLPHMLQWDSRRLEHALEGADLVLLPPTGRLGLVDLLYFKFHEWQTRLSGGHVLWEQLTPEQKRRFDNLRTQIKQDPKRYERLKPAIAGLILLGDFEKGAGLSSAKPGSTVKDLAQVRHISTRPEGGIPVADVFRAVVRMDDRQGSDCLDALLSETERIASRARPLADAWANGDLNAVKGEYLPAGVERCIAGASGLQAFSEKLTRDATASLDAALNKGGKTVAVVDLRLLLRADGVLDRLRAAGASVKSPRS